MASDRCQTLYFDSRKTISYFPICRVFIIILIIFTNCIISVNSLHLKGTWQTSRFFKFLAKFGFQQTTMDDKENTQGYIYGNITSPDNFTMDIQLVLVDSEYFLEYYGNASLANKHNACPAMFKKIDTIAWDYNCNPEGREDFLRRIPCPSGGLCKDEDRPAFVVPSNQFTYFVQDTAQARFWYISIVACYHNTSSSEHCWWRPLPQTSDLQLNYDIWLVNGNPFTKHVNPFEHQFSFEMHDIFEIHLAFFLLYTFTVPIQVYALHSQKHIMPLILTTSMCMEYVGVIFNFIHVFKFAFDGEGVDLLHVVGNFIDQFAQCVFMLLLLLIVKGWTITRMDLNFRTRMVLFTIWGTYTVANMALFIINQGAIDFLSDLDEWQTWPGLLILGFRLGIMLWFLLEMRQTFRLERSKEKMEFYLHFGAGYLVWFVYLPILILISTQVSALWRYKTVLSVSYAADLLSYMVLMNLLWPSRSSLYFNLKVETRIVELEDLTGLSSTRDLHNYDDSESEDSIDIHETAKLLRSTHEDSVIPVKASPKSAKPTSHTEVLDTYGGHLDSGIDSLANSFASVHNGITSAFKIVADWRVGLKEAM